jgi:hypothetical protein
LAGYIAAAINYDNTTYGFGATANAPSNVVSVTDTTLGTSAVSNFSVSGGASGIFTWSGPTAGSNGSNGCTGSTTATYATGVGTTAVAGNFVLAINACTSADGLTQTSSNNGAVVTITAALAGSDGDNITLSPTSGNFAWAGSALSGGADGTTGPGTFAYWSGASAISAADLATNIAAAINQDTSLNTIVSAVTEPVASGGQIVVSALTEGAGGHYSLNNTLADFTWSPTGNMGGGTTATLQPNVYPATIVDNYPTASCSDLAVYPTGMLGSSSSASIVAYSNLYATLCSPGGATTIPSEAWAYSFTPGGTVTTSPITSLDGTQVAFIQNSGGTASLIILKWAPGYGTLTAPDVLTAQSSVSAYRSCTAPCYYAVSLGAGDTFSAPFTDFVYDITYVGDDAGKLHEIFGTFGGPATLDPSGSGFPVTLNGGTTKVSSPVCDPGTGQIFVGDNAGIFWSVPSNGSNGTVHKSTGGLNLNANGSLGDIIADAPLLDVLHGFLYVFVTTSQINNGGNAYPGDNVVYQYNVNFTGYSSSLLYIGAGCGTTHLGCGNNLYAGTFDNVFYQSSTNNGNIWVVGNTGTAGGGTLYRVNISNGSISTPGTPPVVNSAGYPWPSPASEFCNGTCASNGTITTSGTDYLFFSVEAGSPPSGTGGAANTCTTTVGNGCIVSYNINNPASLVLAGTQNFKTPGTSGCWATSAIVIDNPDTSDGGSDVYFVNFNGVNASSPTGSTSANCGAGTATNVLNAVQGLQATP